jgi:hypothetical protein
MHTSKLDAINLFQLSLLVLVRLGRSGFYRGNVGFGSNFLYKMDDPSDLGPGNILSKLKPIAFRAKFNF